MNVIIRSVKRDQRKTHILGEYGLLNSSTKQQEEYADCCSEKVEEAIHNLHKKVTRNASNFDDLKIAVENMSGGANTIILDDIGMPSIVVGLPKMLMSDLYEGASNDVHPAWIVDGTIKEVIYVSKYMNFVANGRAYSLPMRDPHTYFNFEQANKFCLDKGKGWHLLTNATWAAIAAWCKRNNTIPRGNSGMGYAWQAPHEKGVPTAMCGHEPLRTASGSGPVTWNHNHNPSGISDLVGNMFEWVGGLRLLNGEIQIIPQNTAASYDYELCKENNHHWHGITTEGKLSAHAERDTYKIDSFSAGDLSERDHLVGTPIVSTQIKHKSYLGSDINGNQGYLDCYFSDLKSQEGLIIPDILKTLAVFPDDNCTNEDGIFVARNYGERVAVRGGKGGSFDRAGLYSLHFYNPRTYHGSATIGFRSAYINI